MSTLAEASRASAPASASAAAPVTAAAGADIAALEPALLAPLYPLPRLALVSGRGARVTAADGRTYLDFTSGIAVNAFGHAPRGLAVAVARQMRTLGHCSNLFANGPAARLAAALTGVTGYERVFFCNSGTEGVEAALKFARARANARAAACRHGAAPPGTPANGDRAVPAAPAPAPARGVLAFRGGFHGRTAGALAATWTPSYREPFEPLLAGVRFADFNRVEGLDEAVDAGTAAVIVEPVQGEGGAVPATRAFLAALRARCDATGATLIFDEVQSGMGRCGALLAAERLGARADVTVLSKALGAGLPIGAVLMSAEVAGALAPGMHGSTFAGGAVAATAALWALERVLRPGFLAGVRRRADRLSAGLGALVRRHPALSGERGLGLLRAVEVSPGAPFDAPALVKAARGQGLLLVRGGERAVRFLPPLNVTTREIADALERFEAAVATLEKGGEG